LEWNKRIKTEAVQDLDLIQIKKKIWNWKIEIFINKMTINTRFQEGDKDKIINNKSTIVVKYLMIKSDQYLKIN
jgi:hypothetical protein